jgi:hypothetical protein
MKDWKKELDAFVAETVAFVKAVNPAPANCAPATTSKREPPATSVTSSAPLREKALVAPWAAKEREEIRRRLADFKAHQERLMRERDEFAKTMLRKAVQSAPSASKKEM